MKISINEKKDSVFLHKARGFLWILKTKADPRFLKHEDLVAWSLTDLEGASYRWSHCGFGMEIVLKLSWDLNMSVED